MNIARSHSHPSGPRGYQLLKASSFQNYPVETFGQLWKEYGDLVYLPILPNYRMVIASHPRHAEHILSTHSDQYVKPDLLMKNMGLVQGKGLFTSEVRQSRNNTRDTAKADLCPQRD